MYPDRHLGCGVSLVLRIAGHRQVGALGDREQFHDVTEPVRETDVHSAQAHYSFTVDQICREIAAESESGEYRHLRRRVETLDVCRGVAFCKSEALRFSERLFVCDALV